MPNMTWVVRYESGVGIGENFVLKVFFSHDCCAKVYLVFFFVCRY